MLKRIAVIAALVGSALMVATPSFAGNITIVSQRYTTATVVSAFSVDVCVSQAATFDTGWANFRLVDGTTRSEVGFTYSGHCSGYRNLPDLATAVQVCDQYLIPNQWVTTTCSAWVPVKP